MKALGWIFGGAYIACGLGFIVVSVCEPILPLAARASFIALGGAIILLGVARLHLYGGPLE